MRRHSTLMEMLIGYQLTQAISVAAELGLADLLKGGPRSCEALAQATHMHSPSLYRLLRALTAAGLFTEAKPRCFALTRLGARLRTGAPNALRAAAIFNGSDRQWRLWGDLLHSVRTGESAAMHVWGMGSWEYLERHPEVAAIYNEAMAELTALIASAVVTRYSFRGIHTLVDVAAGHGQLLLAILKAHPRMRGILFDLPQVTKSAARHIAAAGLAHRCECLSGDIFASLPRRGDAYILSRVIHNWEDERAVAILRNCRVAMGTQGKLLIVDRVLPTRGKRPLSMFLTDLQMLVGPGGRERSMAEFRALLVSAGFGLTKVVTLGDSTFSLRSHPHVAPPTTRGLSRKLPLPDPVIMEER